MRPLSCAQFFDHDGETLWGLSAYATLMLLAHVPGSTAPTPPWYRIEGRREGEGEALDGFGTLPSPRPSTKWGES